MQLFDVHCFYATDKETVANTRVINVSLPMQDETFVRNIEHIGVLEVPKDAFVIKRKERKCLRLDLCLFKPKEEPGMFKQSLNKGKLYAQNCGEDQYCSYHKYKIDGFLGPQILYVRYHFVPKKPVRIY